MALITAAEARLLIPELTGTNEDTKLSELIDAAGDFIARHYGWPPASAGGAASLEAATHTLYLEGDGSEFLELPLFPVAAAGLTSIHDDPLRAYGASTLVASTDYTVDSLAGLVTLDYDSVHGQWSDGIRRAIKVVGAFGYDTVTDDIKQACRIIVKASWRGRKTQGLQSDSMGSRSVNLGVPLFVPEEAMQLLGNPDHRVATGIAG